MVPSFLDVSSFEGINWALPNEYIMFLDAKDSSGNAAIQKQAVVVVIRRGIIPYPGGDGGSGGGGSSGGGSSGGGGRDVFSDGDGFTVIGDAGVPIGRYVPDGEGGYVYIDENLVAMGRLPTTGGMSLILYLTAGGLLLLAAGTALLRKNKKGYTE